jgi:hypothetical protein
MSLILKGFIFKLICANFFTYYEFFFRIYRVEHDFKFWSIGIERENFRFRIGNSETAAVRIFLPNYYFNLEQMRK